MIRNWLRRWLFNRRRNIFPFWNGRKLVKIDPLVARRVFLSSDDIEFPGDIVDLSTVTGGRGQDELFAKVMPVAHLAFETHPYNGTSGLTELEMQQLMQRFFLYLGALKKNTVVNPISSPVSDSMDSGENSSTSDTPE